MSEEKQADWFEGIETIVSDPLRFKAKLAIGEDAYASLRLKNSVVELWDAVGAVSTGVAIAKLPLIASTFFAPTGMLAFFGIGAAATPIGWVIAAGVVAGGGWIGITRYLKKTSDSRVTTIPDFINTPMDVLALGLFDLMTPLALKVASIDGDIDSTEREEISSYFIKQWGYDADFVREGIAFTEKKLSDFSVKGLAQSLGEFKKHNKDCNFKAMSHEIIGFLQKIVEADGRLDEREEMAIEKVKDGFEDVAKFKFKETVKNGTRAFTSAAKSGVKTATKLARKIGEVDLPFKKN